MANDDKDEAAAICANPDCQVAETDRCIEGFELSACPHYGRELEETAETGHGARRSTVCLRASDCRVLAH